MSKTKEKMERTRILYLNDVYGKCDICHEEGDCYTKIELGEIELYACKTCFRGLYSIGENKSIPEGNVSYELNDRTGFSKQTLNSLSYFLKGNWGAELRVKRGYALLTLSRNMAILPQQTDIIKFHCVDEKDYFHDAKMIKRAIQTLDTLGDHAKRVKRNKGVGTAPLLISGNKYEIWVSPRWWD